MSTIHTNFQSFLESQKYASSTRERIDNLSGKPGDIMEGLRIYHDMCRNLNESSVNEGVLSYLKDKMSNMYQKLFGGKKAAELSKDPKAKEEAKKVYGGIKNELEKEGKEVEKSTILSKIREYLRKKLMPVAFAAMVFLSPSQGLPAEQYNRVEDKFKIEMVDTKYSETDNKKDDNTDLGTKGQKEQETSTEKTDDKF